MTHNIEPLQYPADQAIREQTALLKQIRNAVFFIAIIAALVGFLLVGSFLAATSS